MDELMEENVSLRTRLTTASKALCLIISLNNWPLETQKQGTWYT